MARGPRPVQALPVPVSSAWHGHRAGSGGLPARPGPSLLDQLLMTYPLT